MAYMNSKPAILGGKPVFSAIVPISRPTLPGLDELKQPFEEVFSSGYITNAKYVREFEEAVAHYLGVKHAVAVSSCTSGLMLNLRALELKGEVIVPSFTFSATAHSLIWNGLKPVFVDCDFQTFNINPRLIKNLITPNTSAILGVYIFGSPPDIQVLEEIAQAYNLRLIFDAAHALGGKYKAKLAGGFGEAEVFSLSPTKLLTAGEGGLVTTNNPELARRIRIGRDYGNPGNYDCEFVGLNARMTEFNAILGLKNLETLKANVEWRIHLANLYKSYLSELPGISFQKVDQDSHSTYKDFSILIDPSKFVLDRDELALCLERENIMTKKYYYPPIHRQQAYVSLFGPLDGRLPVTDFLSKNMLSLPIYSHMRSKEVITICKAINRIFIYAEEIAWNLRIKEPRLQSPWPGRQVPSIKGEK